MIGCMPAWIVLPVQGVECQKCAALRQVEVDLADKRRTQVKGFERYALELCRICTV